jgi:hypothetical protein
MKTVLIFFLTILGMLTLSCKQSFEPEVTKSSINLLVVEGLINIGNDSTIIKLSRTVILDNKNTVKPEIGATVIVESESSEKFPLVEMTPGKYASPSLNLNVNKKYRVNIKSKGGISYLSEFVSGKTTPPIDSISYIVKSNGVQFYANTHDATNNSRYYRYEYVETWLFHPLYHSLLISDGKKLLERNLVTQNIYNCWQSYNSSTILLASTIKLNQDIVSLQPLTFVNSDSEKIMDKYSILVKQFAVTRDEFEFWETLKRNTESLGSIFDAQPSQLIGNLHNVNFPNEPVLGFVGVGTFQSKRIFISKTRLPNWITAYPYKCNLDTVRVVSKSGSRDQEDRFHSFRDIPIEFVMDGPTALGSTKACSDCTIRGINKAPDFWQ